GGGPPEPRQGPQEPQAPAGGDRAMSAVSPGRDADRDDGQDWPGDVELDLRLLSAQASGLSALGEVIDTEQGLAAILTRQPTEGGPGPQRPGGDQLSGPAASRSPPPPARPQTARPETSPSSQEQP